MFIISTTTYAQEQIVWNEWFTYISDSFEGYMHFSVFEEEEKYRIQTDAKIITDDKKLVYYKINTTNEKDMFLTTKTYTVNVQDNKEANFSFRGNVKKQGDSLIWKTIHEKKEHKLITNYPTLNYFSSFFVLTQLNYSKKGIILEFNSLEIDELLYKKNHYFEYIDDESINISGENIQAKKIITYGDGIGESTFWLDDNNNLVKASIDNYKNMVRCKKEDIDFTLFAK